MHEMFMKQRIPFYEVEVILFGYHRNKINILYTFFDLMGRFNRRYIAYIMPAHTIGRFAGYRFKKNKLTGNGFPFDFDMDMHGRSKEHFGMQDKKSACR